MRYLEALSVFYRQPRGDRGRAAMGKKGMMLWLDKNAAIRLCGVTRLPLLKTCLFNTADTNKLC
jgi:hypothetical protein